MDEFQKRLAVYLREFICPQKQLDSHRAFWGDNPPPRIADLMDNIQAWLDAGGGPKVLYGLSRLAHFRTIEEWNTDPDTIAGERRREQSREFAGRANAERKQAAQARHALWLAEDEKLRSERPAITSKKRRAEIIRERIGETHSVDRISKTLPAR